MAALRTKLLSQVSSPLSLRKKVKELLGLCNGHPKVLVRIRFARRPLNGNVRSVGSYSLDLKNVCESDDWFPWLIQHAYAYELQPSFCFADVRLRRGFGLHIALRREQSKRVFTGIP